ncbi:MAG: hypothetical protein QG558_1550 [Campylobacterota bacterium]|nr:hypothetical protein [Campylobacterota bacterium]
MCKKETRFALCLVFFCFSISLNAKIMLGKMSSIENNSAMTLLDNNKPVKCEPHGIKTLEGMIRDAATPTECQKRVDAFYYTHPHERLYAQEHLHLHQTYHYEKSDKGCILYANGPESYSEMLLNEGLAVVDEKYNNSEWNEKLKRALLRGQKKKERIHDSDILQKCIEKKR